MEAQEFAVTTQMALWVASLFLAGLVAFLILWLKSARTVAVMRADRVVLSRKQEAELISRDRHYDGKIQNMQSAHATELSEREREIAVLQERLQAEIDAGELKLDAAYKSGNDKLLAERKASENALEAERRQAAEKLAVLTDARQQLTREFQALADAALKSNTEHVRKQHRAELDTLLGPLQKRLGEFQERLSKSHSEAATERALLGQQIQELKSSSSRMSDEAGNLAKALKGQSQLQGAWGEMVLASILEKSGLREGEEFHTQVNFQGEENQRLRPDVIVDLPGEADKVVIDSKVSLKAFDEYVNLDERDEIARSAALKRHLASIRNHILTLSDKEYQAAVGTQLDYVILFIPIEGALSLALKEDPALTAFAAEKNIAITTPTTLMVALRTIANVWRIEHQNRNAQEIARQAGNLYDKFFGLVEDLRKIDRQLDTTRRTYDGAMKKLHTGHGNLISRAERLKQLGVKSAKQLERDLAERARESDTSLAPLSQEPHRPDEILN